MPGPRRRYASDAEDWLRKKDRTVRIIGGEMAEYVGRINLLWTLAIERLDSDPSDALAKLIDVEILLENHVRVEREDLLAIAKEGAERLAGELPSEPEDRPAQTT